MSEVRLLSAGVLWDPIRGGDLLVLAAALPPLCRVLYNFCQNELIHQDLTTTSVPTVFGEGLPRPASSRLVFLLVSRQQLLSLAGVCVFWGLNCGPSL